MKRKIYIYGAGYVGLSNGVLLAQSHDVTLVDIDPRRVNKINNRKSPIKDYEIEKYLAEKDLTLAATDVTPEEVTQADYVIISTPTNFDEKSGKFDTSSIECVLSQLRTHDFNGVVVIRSTVPLGYTHSLREKGWQKIIFVPEFLREGSALKDSLNPSRIVIGTTDFQNSYEEGLAFGKLLLEGAQKKDSPVVIMNSTEAESVKLFSNTYLALRVAFFNELDSYAFSNNLNSKDIISAIGLDPRIGNFYQNPSFGYGGYCLPKDTKQLLSSYGEVPQTIISAIVKSNDIRKRFIVDKVMERKPKTVGIFRLVMKKNSDNFRESAILDVIDKLKEKGVNILIYEPLLNVDSYRGNPVIKEFDEFVNRSDLIMANRIENRFLIPENKLFTRDIFEDS